MSYSALYRKFRPQTFDEVKGQDHIVTTLKNQIVEQEVLEKQPSQRFWQKQ